MRLRKSCEHDRYDEHQYEVPCPEFFGLGASGQQTSCTVAHFAVCPGGEFLPEDAIVENRAELTAAIEDADYRLEQGNSISPPYVDRTLLVLVSAARKQLALAADQVGEPG